MKAEQLKKALDFLRPRKNTVAYKEIAGFLRNPANTKIRPVKVGHGRGTNYIDYSNSIIHLLNMLGLRYKVGNDAPRPLVSLPGGRFFDYIEILSKVEI